MRCPPTPLHVANCAVLAWLVGCASSPPATPRDPGTDAAVATMDADVLAALDAPVDATADLTVDATAMTDAVSDAADGNQSPPVADAGPAPCDEVDRFRPVFATDIARWTSQDGDGPWPEGGVVFAGSSSIRRWETLARTFSAYAPIQRGVGGAQLAEIAGATRALIARHNPRAVVVYAGTNDLAGGVAPAVVLDRLRCLRHRVGEALGWRVPLLFINVAPNPSRWAGWSNARAFNASVEALAATDPAVVYVDIATPFLATGAPPDASLFVRDGLHLSERGYALWTDVVRAALQRVLPPRPALASGDAVLSPGGRLLIDLGPSNPEDGETTPSPDYLGQHWNNWHPLRAPGAVLPGERLRDLVTSTGARTTVSLVIDGGFLSNGRRNGGLRWPDRARLGSLAVGSATGDFFFVQDEDAPGALSLRGLDPARAYTLRLFGARDDSELRVTRYTVQGAAVSSASLQTSGPGAGASGATVNDDDVATLRGVRPDAWGTIHVDVAIERGAFAYLSALELIAE